MPSINEAIEAAKQFRGQPITAPTPNAPAPFTDGQPSRNTMIRCPMPPIWQASPDSLRQFYNGGIVPQSRIMTPIPATSSGNVTTNESVFVQGGGSGGGSGRASVVSATLYTTQVSIKTQQLPPGTKYVGQLAMAQSFQLIGIASASPIRFQLYGSKAAQQADLARGLDAAAPAGVLQNLICDIALDTLPYQWAFQSRVGSNSEAPQTNQVYVTITNLDITSDAATVTIQYVPLSQGNR